MPKLDLIDLRLFLCVIESGSITHGAAEANLALIVPAGRRLAVYRAARCACGSG